MMPPLASSPSPTPDPAATPPPGSASAAARYWAGNLDPQNLERASGEGPGVALEDEIRFAWTPDVAAAWAWIEGQAGVRGPVMDLGAGLGSVSFALARRGARVICVDTSVERLRVLMQRARAAGVAGSILPLAAAAEALPVRTDTLPGLFTKSVLIHTDLPRAAAEIARALRPGGRAGLAEPQPGNPFAWLYRRTLAPKAWREITRYFGEGEQRIFLEAVGTGRVVPFYAFGFLAFVFQYAWPNPALFGAALKVLGWLDGALLALVPPARRLAWFGVIEAEKRTAATDGKAKHG